MNCLEFLTSGAGVKIAHFSTNHNMTTIVGLVGRCDRFTFNFDAEQLKIGLSSSVSDSSRVEIRLHGVVDSSSEAMVGDVFSGTVMKCHISEGPILHTPMERFGENSVLSGWVIWGRVGPRYAITTEASVRIEHRR